MKTKIGSHTDAVLAISVIGLILLLIIPLPAILLDVLLSFSIVMSVMTLLLTLYIENALEFNAFPSLLLFLTLFRLGLNIASTRMILTRAEGGDIISTFGGFVTQGNTIVGLILFLLLTIINFIVVTKGAGRIAEVAARFTLEALPGKQMSIDADLASGALSQKEAKKERVKVNAEAEFYGAMDGASKFVRGDAIVSLIIIAVNIVGGFIIGVMVKGLSVEQCWTTFTRLTVGDGLVSQIPALLVSVGAGIIVTRASSGSVGETIPKQIFNNPKVLKIAAVVLALLSLVPGMPTIIMLSIATALYLYAAILAKERKQERVPQKREESEQSVEKALLVHPIEVQLGTGLLSFAEELQERTSEIRAKVAAKLGVITPSIYICDNLAVRPRNYVIKIKGITAATGKGEDLSALALHLTQVIENNAYKLLTRQDVANMIESVKRVDSAVIDELIPHKLNLGHILKVLQNLLKEHLPIRDFVSILEALADHASQSKAPDPDLLTEKVRQRLSQAISEHLFHDQKKIYAITLDPKVEQMIGAAVQKGEFGATLALRPKSSEKIVSEILRLIAKAGERGLSPIILTGATTRYHLRQLLERQIPELPVLSFSEVVSDIEVHSLGTISSDVLL